MTNQAPSLKIIMAQVFATAAHAAVEQKRKYTGEDYIVHPAEVASIVASFGGTEAQICAAWLHDTVEDTGVTLDDIRNIFGTEIAELVGWLTDVSKPEDGNRKVRKRIDKEHTKQAPAEAQFVKCADLISNTKSITEYDPGFAVTYLQEKQNTLDIMHKIADTPILAEAWKTWKQGKTTLDSTRVQEALRKMEDNNRNG